MPSSEFFFKKNENYFNTANSEQVFKTLYIVVSTGKHLTAGPMSFNGRIFRFFLVIQLAHKIRDESRGATAVSGCKSVPGKREARRKGRADGRCSGTLAVDGRRGSPAGLGLARSETGRDLIGTNNELQSESSLWALVNSVLKVRVVH